MAYIAVDIGHGSNTYPPSKGVRRNGRGYAEHDFNAKLGIAVKELLEDNGHKVIFGQQPNKPDVPLRTRTNLYNREGVDLVISLHANAGGANGRCVFYWGTSSKSKALAVDIRDAIKAKGYSTHGNGLHAGKRGSWTNLHINRETRMPAVLVEHGFMDGSKDFDLIFGSKQDRYIKDMAEADVQGIQKWLGESFKGEAAAPSTPSKPKPSKPNGSGGSIVDYMNRQNMNSSFSNRKKLAEQYGIKGYKGTATQNINLLNKLKSGAKSKKPSKSNKPTGSVKNYKGSSIVDYLNLSGNKHLGGSSFNNRKKLASQHGIKNYRGTGSQNRELLRKLQGGSSSTPSKPSVRKGSTVTARRLYTTSDSSKNVRSTPIKGYVDTINNKWRNEIRLRNKKGGHYIGFTRRQDLI